MTSRIVARIVTFLGLLVCSPALFAVTNSVVTNGYTFTSGIVATDTSDSCRGASGFNCLKAITNGAPASGFTYIAAASGSSDVYAIGGTSTFYVDFSPMFQNPPASVIWRQDVVVNAAFGLAVQSSQNVYALILGSCPASTYAVARRRLVILQHGTQWQYLPVSPAQCATSIGVSADNTLVAVNSVAGTFSYLLAGGTAWSQAIGTGFTGSPTAMGATMAYAMKGGNIVQINLATGATYAVAVNTPTPLAVASKLDVDSIGNLWIVDTTGRIWNQNRSAVAFGVKGPAWIQYAGSATSISGFDTNIWALSGTTPYHLNKIGLELTNSVVGSFPAPCPFGISCTTTTHTTTARSSFLTGGLHGQGVILGYVGHVLDAVNLVAVERSPGCDMYNTSDDACKIDDVHSGGWVSCSEMGAIGTTPGLPSFYIKRVYTRFRSDSKSCVPNPAGGGDVCSYNVVSWCTPETTPPALDAFVINNEFDTVGFPVFFDAWGECIVISGFPIDCRALSGLPTRINTFPRAACTTLP